MRPTRIAAFSLAFLLTAPGVSPIRAADKTTDKPTVQAPEDQALVYFIRPKRHGGSKRTAFVYMDDEFLGVLDNNSFTHALVEEGRHMLWTNWTKVNAGFEAIPGRTYYFRFDFDRFVELDEAEGANWIEQVKFYSSPTSKEEQTSTKHLAKRSGEAVERFEATHAEVPDYPTPEMPADTAGYVRVDEETEISLELVQNLTTHLDAIGDEVWFRVARDSMAGDRVWLRQGTLVRGILYHALGGKSGGRGGALDLVVPAVVALDGTLVPTVGATQEQGGVRSKKTIAVGVVVMTTVAIIPGLFAGGLIKGDEAYQLAGSTTTVYTRDPVWIAPGGGVVESEEREPDASALRLHASDRAPIRFVPRKRKRPDDVELLLEHPERPETIRVRSVAGQAPPVAIEAKEVTEADGGWLCIFDGWQIVRFLPVTDLESRIELELEGALEGGVEFVADAAVDLEVVVKD